MQPNPFARLLHSRKFWLLILDTAVSIFTIIGGLYLVPERMELTLGLIATIQPVFIFVIKAITDEDVANLSLLETQEYSRQRAIARENDQGAG